jgi:hypothetical protein
MAQSCRRPGAIWGKVRDKGFTGDELKKIGDSSEPGTAIAEDHVIERLENDIAGYERIARHTVSAEAALASTATGLCYRALALQPGPAKPGRVHGSVGSASWVAKNLSVVLVFVCGSAVRSSPSASR